MAIPSHFLGTTIHEGSHAIVAKMFGAEILDFKIFPSRDPATGAFYFGLVRYRGNLTHGQRAFFHVAPKLADMALLGTYSVLLGTDALPDNRYARLAFAVAFTGTTVDFSRGLLSVSPTTDTMRAYKLWGVDTFAAQLPYRALQLAITTAAGYMLYREYDRIFSRGPSERQFLLPVLSGAF